MAAKYDLSIDQGSNKLLQFTVYENEALAGNLVPLAGHTSKFWVSPALGQKAVLEIDSSNGLSISGSVISVEIRHAATSALKFAGVAFKGVYQLELTDPSGKVFRVVEGTFTIHKEIIKP